MALKKAKGELREGPERIQEGTNEGPERVPRGS